jgi:hypothetical protein
MVDPSLRQEIPAQRGRVNRYAIIIKLRRSYFPNLKGLREITLSKFDNYGC